MKTLLTTAVVLLAAMWMLLGIPAAFACDKDIIQAEPAAPAPEKAMPDMADPIEQETTAIDEQAEEAAECCEPGCDARDTAEQDAEQELWCSDPLPDGVDCAICRIKEEADVRDADPGGPKEVVAAAKEEQAWEEACFIDDVAMAMANDQVNEEEMLADPQARQIADEPAQGNDEEILPEPEEQPEPDED